MDMLVVGVGAAMDRDPGPDPSFAAKLFVVAPSEVGAATVIYTVGGAKGLRNVEVCFV